MIKRKPPRLDLIYIDRPLYFVTFCTLHRRPALANEQFHKAFREYCARAGDYGIAVGRYVVMPDHVHLFVAGNDDFDLGIWVRGLKRATALESKLWQPGFSTISCGATNVTKKNGITYSRTRFGLDWFAMQRNGLTRVRLF